MLQAENTPLHISCRDGHMDIAKLLLQNGADATIPDRVSNSHVHALRMHISQESSLCEDMCCNAVMMVRHHSSHHRCGFT